MSSWKEWVPTLCAHEQICPCWIYKYRKKTVDSTYHTVTRTRSIYVFMILTLLWPWKRKMIFVAPYSGEAGGRGKRLELAWLEFWGAVWYGGDKGCERGKEVGGERKRQRVLASMLWRCEEWDFREKGEEVRSNLWTHCCLSCKVMPFLFLHDWCKDFSYLSTGFLDMGLRLGLGLLSFECGAHTEVDYEEKALFGLHCDFICAKIKCVCIMTLYICIKTFWKQPKNIFIM